MESSIIRTLARSSESSGRIALFMILDARIVVKRIFSCKQTHIHTSVGENQQKHVLKNLRYRSAFHFIGIGSFQGWGNMKPCKKSFDRFRNMRIILSRLCYIFIHSMSFRFVIVFWQLIISKLLVSYYFYASYYRHILMCEVWVIMIMVQITRLQGTARVINYAGSAWLLGEIKNRNRDRSRTRILWEDMAAMSLWLWFIIQAKRRLRNCYKAYVEKKTD